MVNQSEQAAGSFVIGWGTGRGLLAERTYEHQQHPAPFSGEYRMHSCNMAALSSRIIPERTGRRRRIEPSSVTVTAPLLSMDLHIPSEREIRSESIVKMEIQSFKDRRRDSEDQQTATQHISKLTTFTVTGGLKNKCQLRKYSINIFWHFTSRECFFNHYHNATSFAL